jgi:hypothetical protein
MDLLATRWISRLHVLPPIINTKMNAPISVFNVPIHDRSSKFRIYETSRAHNSKTFLSSGTQQGFVVQEPCGLGLGLAGVVTDTWTGEWCHCQCHTAFPELMTMWWSRPRLTHCHVSLDRIDWGVSEVELWALCYFLFLCTLCTFVYICVHLYTRLDITISQSMTNLDNKSVIKRAKLTLLFCSSLLSGVQELLSLFFTIADMAILF